MKNNNINEKYWTEERELKEIFIQTDYENGLKYPTDSEGFIYGRKAIEKTIKELVKFYYIYSDEDINEINKNLLEK